MLKGLETVCSGSYCLVKLVLEITGQIMGLDKGCSSGSQQDSKSQSDNEGDEDFSPFPASYCLKGEFLKLVEINQWSNHYRGTETLKRGIRAGTREGQRG